MDNAFKMIADLVGHLTKILVAVIGLGVVAGNVSSFRYRFLYEFWN